MSSSLRGIGVQATHVCGRTSQAARLKAWNPFILDEVEACTATKTAMRGLQILKPVLPANSEVPMGCDIDMTHGDVLLFFREDGELAILKRLRIIPAIIG
jgi:hypothetical protein